MKTFDNLIKDRELISRMLRKATRGEINDFDFIVDYVSTGRPIVRFMFAVPGKIKKQYDGDMIKLLDNHDETIKSVISAAGYPEIFSRSIVSSVL